MYKQHYQRFLQYHRDELHCAPHSHHYWPDVTFDAQQLYWLDSARGADEKWQTLFSDRLPAVQQQLTELLGNASPSQWVFASNTHELLYRIISCFEATKPLHIVSTDGEFHSFSRQLARLRERRNVKVSLVPCQPYDSFAERWQAATQQADIDLIFTSQVFFNSGVIAPNWQQWLPQVANDVVVVVDGYHGCGAVDTDLSAYADRIFYLAGGYKYLQAGEGCCFMSVPRDCPLRPEYTGWFADFEHLEGAQPEPVQYAESGQRFAGATMDFSGIYRLHAVLDWWQREQLSVARQNHYINELKKSFLSHLKSLDHPLLNDNNRLQHHGQAHGRFFTYEINDKDQLQRLYERLLEQGVKTDYRGNRLRFGFALYHDPDDYCRIKG